MRRLKKNWGKLKLLDARIPPKRKTSAPSTKKGRFSGKKVSKALRLTTAGRLRPVQIGIDRRVQGEIAGEAVLQVESGGAMVVVTTLKGVAGVTGA